MAVAMMCKFERGQIIFEQTMKTCCPFPERKRRIPPRMRELRLPEFGVLPTEFKKGRGVFHFPVPVIRDPEKIITLPSSFFSPVMGKLMLWLWKLI
jgi:hypothetical protein